MTRLILVAAIWLIFVGGLALYMQQRDAARPEFTPAAKPKTAEEHYAIEVTPSFAPAPDPFALQSPKAPPAPAIVVRLAEQEWRRLSDNVEAGRPVRIEDVNGLVQGSNELYIQVSPHIQQSDRRHFVLVRVLRDDVPIAEETLWSEGGAQVAGTLRFTVRQPDEGKNDDH